LARLLNFQNADKLFFHFFQSFFERPSGHTCRVNTPFTGTPQGLASFFFDFFEVFLSGRNRNFTSIDTDFLPANWANNREWKTERRGPPTRPFQGDLAVNPSGALFYAADVRVGAVNLPVRKRQCSCQRELSTTDDLIEHGDGILPPKREARLIFAVGRSPISSAFVSARLIVESGDRSLHSKEITRLAQRVASRT